MPKFRIITGWPSTQFINGAMTNIAQWSTLERFWLSFVGGEYHHSFEESVINGVADPGYIFKFEADGYAPVVSRFHSYAIEVGPAARRYMEAVMGLPAWTEWRAAAPASLRAEARPP